MTATTRLTHYSPSGGCAGKLPQAPLDEVLGTVQSTGLAEAGTDLLVGLSTPDDAAVYAVDEHRAWVVTTDFLTPVVDDPYQWGRIAATNALSDVYAMGARPLLALNLLGWPADLPHDLLDKVLRGGGQAVGEAGALLAGGHSIIDPVPKLGLVAVGEADPRRLLAKDGGQAGDQLVLTKPLGVGVVGTAIKHGQARKHVVEQAVTSMTRLNADAARIAHENGLHGGTDVTGYGLLGHLHEMTAAAGLTATIRVDEIPRLPGVLELIAAGCAPDGSRQTLATARQRGWFNPVDLDEVDQLLLADAQTSGGLLLAVPPSRLDAVLTGLHAAGDTSAARVGSLVDDGLPGSVTAETRPR